MKFVVQKTGWTYAADKLNHILMEMNLSRRRLEDNLFWLFDTEREAAVELNTDRLKQVKVKVMVSIEEIKRISGVESQSSFTWKSNWDNMKRADIKRLELWLRKPPGERSRLCPWKDLLHRRCDLCRDIFPKFNRLFLEGCDDCPCDVLNMKYVVRTVRAGIEEWKKKNLKK